MKKITLLLLSSLLLSSAVACSQGSETAAGPQGTPDQAAKNDATSQVRRDQANSDIRAREQRNDVGGDQVKRADSDLASEVRSKLEVNIPKSKLTVAAKDGAVTVAGNVSNQAELAKIDTLAKQILGVKSVTNQAKVAK